MNLQITNTHIVKRLLIGRNNRPLKQVLSKMAPKDISCIFLELNIVELERVVEILLELQVAGLTISALPPKLLQSYFMKLSETLQINTIDKTPANEAITILNVLPKERQKHIISSISSSSSYRISKYLAYPKNSAGRLMTEKVFRLPTSMTAKDSMLQLKKWTQNSSLYYIYCTAVENGKERLSGVISLRQLAIAPEDICIQEVIEEKNLVTVQGKTTTQELAQLFNDYNFIALPVVDEEQQLLGIVTIDDVIDLLQEQVTANVYTSAGLQSDDRIDTPTGESIKKRLPWMFLNLFLAAIASFVVSLFENTMGELIILASLKNIVAGMGGNTAIQSLAVITREIATSDFSFISKWKVLKKEVLVGVVIGLATGLGAGLLTYFWKENISVSIVICLSMILNSIVATICGGFIPLILKYFNRDPAISGGVLVTTLVDAFSFFSFLGIASLALHYFGS